VSKYRRVTATFLGVALVAGLAGPAAASPRGAHLRLTKSAPAKEASLATSPAEIRLWFSLPPELSISRIKVTGADGTEVALGDVTADVDNVLFAALLEPVPAGDYEVSWRTSSGDGHPLTGTFDFAVQGTR
jgi:hypothetical protein